MRNDLILIAAVDRNWGIGKDNQLLRPIPEDLKRFRELTCGNLIIVGRKTLESFKDKKPLPDRLNVVLTRDRGYTCQGAVMVHDLDELAKAIEGFPGEVYLCGGETVYRQLLRYCSRALITQIDEAYPADNFIDNLDTLPDWEKTHVGEWQTSKVNVRFRYVDYERRGS
jgi:dihydrofolate reductase